MIFSIITTQKQIYESFLKTGLISRGIKKKIIAVRLFNLHDFAKDAHRSIDDTPYGGGPGMVLRVDVVDRAVRKLKNKKSKVILLTPQGEKFNQKNAKKLAKEKELILIAGRFEGYDERIRGLVDKEISVGDYVLTNGDLATFVLIDAISRQIAGFIEKPAALQEESFANDLLEYPQYTRPAQYNNKKVPPVLLSGDHQKIAAWRQKQAEQRTQQNRPDLTRRKKMV